MMDERAMICSAIRAVARGRLLLILCIVAVTSAILVACPAPRPQIIEKVVTSPPQVVEKIVTSPPQVVEKVVTRVVEKVAEDYTTPHPILSDLRVRQAIAYCTDRDAMIAAVYPHVEERAALRLDAGVPKTHWAWSGPYEAYDYAPSKGKALLEEAGWKQPEDAEYRLNDKGDLLALKLSTTTASFRQAWAAIFEQNLQECGIQVIRQHVPPSWWFGDTTGLKRRDFEMGAFAWIGESDPKGRMLYACDQIPLPSNDWKGDNTMGWCNETASQAVILATNTIELETRKQAYDVLWRQFAADMVSLPLFLYAEAEAWSKNLAGITVDSTEYATASAAQWKRTDGGETVVIGFTQEPASMFSLVETSAVQAQLAQMAYGTIVTQYGFLEQAVQQDGLSSIESGRAQNNTVQVRAGDMVYDATGAPVKLAKGVRLFDADGHLVEYDGASAVNMKQLVVRYGLRPYTWSDGTPGSIEDVKLAYRINCDRQSGAIDFSTCDSIANIEYGEGLEWTIAFWPGVQNPAYHIMPFSHHSDAAMYPSHQVLSDGRKLADVPAAEWADLPEIAEKPLSWGPFMITGWTRGQSIELEANPHYQPGAAVKKISVVFIEDINEAVARLLSGELDYIDKAALRGSAEIQTVIEAAKAGTVNCEIVPGLTWEHIDFNLYAK